MAIGKKDSRGPSTAQPRFAQETLISIRKGNYLLLFKNRDGSPETQSYPGLSAAFTRNTILISMLTFLKKHMGFSIPTT